MFTSIITLISWYEANMFLNGINYFSSWERPKYAQCKERTPLIGVTTLLIKITAFDIARHKIKRYNHNTLWELIKFIVLRFFRLTYEITRIIVIITFMMFNIITREHAIDKITKDYRWGEKIQQKIIRINNKWYYVVNNTTCE